MVSCTLSMHLSNFLPAQKQSSIPSTGSKLLTKIFLRTGGLSHTSRVIERRRKIHMVLSIIVMQMWRNEDKK